MAKLSWNFLLQVPLIRRLWPSNEAIKSRKERSHTLETAELVLRLAPQLRHATGRTREQIHNLAQKQHELVKLLCSNVEPSAMRIENDTQENVPL
jgi:hypothetical protein